MHLCLRRSIADGALEVTQTTNDQLQIPSRADLLEPKIPNPTHTSYCFDNLAHDRVERG